MRKAIHASLIVFLTIGQTTMLLAQESDTLTCDKHSSCCCTNNDATPAGIMISHIHPKNEWMISYKFMNMGMNGLVHGNQQISKETVFSQYLMAPDHMQMNMHMLMAMYGITDRLTVMGMVNYNQYSMSMSMFTNMSGHHHPGMTDANGSNTMSASGLGDMKLYALYGLLNKNHHQVLVSMGISFPTAGIQSGSSYCMQLGSGTYDLLPAINYLYQKQKVTIGTQVSSVIHTGYNSSGYKMGNECALNGWFAYQWLNILSSSVRMEGSIADQVSGNDPALYAYNEPAANPANYGGKRVSCYIGSVLQPRKGMFKNTGLGLEYGIPVYQYWNGIQMNTRHIINVSLSIGF